MTIRRCDSGHVYDLCNDRDACEDWPPRKAITALIVHCQSQSYSEIEVKAQATLVSCAGLERYWEGNPGRPRFVAKQHSCET